MDPREQYADFSWYRGSQEWLRDRTIFLTRHGSHAYGTNLPTSDVDLKGICIPPKQYFFGYLEKFEQAENKGDLDVVIYDIRKFVQLAADCNPNIIEVLFADRSDWIATHALPWGRLLQNRELFLSKAAQHRFSGYAFSQLKRIQTHRAWLLNPPKKHPERADYGLPDAPTLAKEQFGFVEARIRKLEDKLGGQGWTKDKVEERDEELVAAVAGEVDLAPALIPLIIAERKYNGAMRNWVAYQKWKSERNEKRAELEAQYGYDTKHAMHLVRLMRMAVEILRDGKVLVKRPDAEELLAIRAGAWKYDDLIAWARKIEADLPGVAAASKLPHDPPRKQIDQLLVRIVEEYLE